MRYFWFSYHASTREARHSRSRLSPYKFDLHQVRDGGAFAEIAASLGGASVYGGLLFNLPRRKSAERVDLTTSDLLVLPTRPPVHDKEHGDKRTIATSGSWLEKKVFRSLKAVFRTCSRSHIILSTGIERLLPKETADHCDIVFRQSTGAWYERYRKNAETQWVDLSRLRNRPRTTAGYLVYTPNLWSDGPSLLAAFGLGGLETLIWARILRTHLSSIVQEAVQNKVGRLVMGEFDIPRDIRAPISLSFVDGCPVRIIADVSTP
jgi:hypothetical protein